MPPVKVFRNGKAYFNCNIALVLNHSPQYLSGIPEEFILKGRMYEKAGLFNTLKSTMKVMGRIPLAEFWEQGGFCYFEAGLWWEPNSGLDAFQLFYVSKAYTDAPLEIPITGLIPLEFLKASYLAPGQTDSGASNILPSLTADCPINAKGRWHLAHPFTDEIKGSNVIYLWRYAAPAIFESHSHVMSNHCATLPAIWEKNGLLAMLEPGYSFQDFLGPMVKGEMVSISVKPTNQVATVFHEHLKTSSFQRPFPFLRSTFYRVGTVLPMDMEFMHYLGYEGVPIVQDHQGAKWYCWNKKWKRTTNNVETYLVAPYGGGQMIPKPFESEPASVDGETWSFMSTGDQKKYSGWHEQLGHHEPLIDTTAKNASALIMPLFHFDPRRYCGKRSGKESPDFAFQHVIPSGQWDGTSKFAGFKLYTAMGWAPMDPRLKTPLSNFYKRCEADQIPLMNHCSPAGFYSHDRKFYFDLHKEKGWLAATDLPDSEGWSTKFPNWAYTPRNTVWKQKGVKLEPATEKEKIWWYCQHYVAPSSWARVIKKHPKLKLCFAHFASSDHLEEGSWSGRKIREPESTPHDLTIGFDGPKLDAYRTHSFLYDLFEMIQPENRVFTDLSYVILKTENAYNFRRLIEWAREHKPILLERILWGTDWPLIGDEKMAKNADLQGLPKPVPLLYKYAKGFTEWTNELPNDFFIRCCFLNPMQFWGIHKLKSLAPALFKQAWVNEIPASVFEDYKGDKLRSLYEQNSKLFKKLAG